MATAPAEDVNPPLDPKTRPPFLRRVRIEGYKSLARCDVCLQPLTILVGRNASGKSNFLDALAFLRDVLARGTDEAVRMHGGRRSILSRTGRGSSVAFEAEFLYRIEGVATEFRAKYRARVRIPNRAKPAIATERVRVRGRNGEDEVGFDREGERVRWVGSPENGSSFLIDWCPPDRLMLGITGNVPFLGLNLGLGLSGFYNFSPAAIRQLQEPTPGVLLERDGRNLASVVESITRDDPEIIDRVMAYLSAIVEEVQGFKVVHYGDYETIRFLLRAGEGGKPLAFDAASMSDGTLRVLAALVAAWQVHLPNGPSLVGIEEPETALHPSAMRALLDALDEATARTQVLLTTHSAELLADPALHPSQVLVVRNRAGRTQITPLDPASREIIARELYSLPELQRQDLLELDEADLRRQAAPRPDDGGDRACRSGSG